MQNGKTVEARATYLRPSARRHCLTAASPLTGPRPYRGTTVVSVLRWWTFFQTRVSSLTWVWKKSDLLASKSAGLPSWAAPTSCGTSSPSWCRAALGSITPNVERGARTRGPASRFRTAVAATGTSRSSSPRRGSHSAGRSRASRATGRLRCMASRKVVKASCGLVTAVNAGASPSPLPTVGLA